MRWGPMVISKHGVSASIDHDGFISAMARAYEEANCQSPVPGPLDKATTWIILARVGWRLEQMVHMAVAVISRQLQDYSFNPDGWRPSELETQDSRDEADVDEDGGFGARFAKMGLGKIGKRKQRPGELESTAVAG